MKPKHLLSACILATAATTVSDARTVTVVHSHGLGLLNFLMPSSVAAAKPEDIHAAGKLGILLENPVVTTIKAERARIVAVGRQAMMPKGRSDRLRRRHYRIGRHQHDAVDNEGSKSKASDNAADSEGAKSKASDNAVDSNQQAPTATHSSAKSSGDAPVTVDEHSKATSNGDEHSKTAPSGDEQVTVNEHSNAASSSAEKHSETAPIGDSKTASSPSLHPKQPATAKLEAKAQEQDKTSTNDEHRTSTSSDNAASQLHEEEHAANNPPVESKDAQASESQNPHAKLDSQPDHTDNSATTKTEQGTAEAKHQPPSEPVPSATTNSNDSSDDKHVQSQPDNPSTTQLSDKFAHLLKGQPSVQTLSKKDKGQFRKRVEDSGAFTQDELKTTKDARKSSSPEAAIQKLKQLEKKEGAGASTGDAKTELPDSGQSTPKSATVTEAQLNVMNF